MTLQKKSRFKPFVGVAVIIFVLAFIAWQFLMVGNGPDSAADVAPPTAIPAGQ